MSLRDLPIQHIMPSCQNLSSRKSSGLIPRTVVGWQDEGMAQGFGARLRLAMEKKNWNARTLAEKADLEESTVSRHLEREKPPRQDSIEKYRVALGVSSEWLAYDRGDMYAATPVSTAEPRVEVLLGSAALERAMALFDWPDEDFVILDAVAADARSEASAAGKDRTESMWTVRLRQLIREHQGRAKPVPRRQAVNAVDLTQESPEIRRSRKVPKRA